VLGGERTLEITGIQRHLFLSAGIPPFISDNRRGRKECAGCRNVPSGNDRQDRATCETCMGQ